MRPAVWRNQRRFCKGGGQEEKGRGWRGGERKRVARSSKEKGGEEEKGKRLARRRKEKGRARIEAHGERAGNLEEEHGDDDGVRIA